MRSFSIGSDGRDFQFNVDAQGWVRAVTRADGSTPVIGGQFDLDHDVSVPETWSIQDEATGFNAKIAEGDEFYPGAGFDASLVQGQVADVLWALPRSQSRPTGRLLELGCGPGFLLEALRDALPGWSVHGVDPSTASVEHARSRGLDVTEGFVDTAAADGPFDAVVVMGNFQLHPDPGATLAALAALSAPGAELYVDLKNPKSAPRRLARRLLRLPVAQSDRRVNAFAAHAWHGMRHGIPKEALSHLFPDNGWTIQRTRTVGPRLLRFDNKHGLARGTKGAVWAGLDRLDGVIDERAWIQVSGSRV